MGPTTARTPLSIIARIAGTVASIPCAPFSRTVVVPFFSMRNTPSMVVTHVSRSVQPSVQAPRNGRRTSSGRRSISPGISVP
jgi:hypothetical protein